MAEKTNFVEYAKVLFWQDMDAPKVANEMLAAGASKSAVKAIFQKLLDDGYGFLPGLSKLAASTTDAAHGGFDGSAPNRDEMQRYLTERADAERKARVSEDHPVLTALGPNFIHGAVQDRANGKRDVLAALGRSASDAVTNAAAWAAAPFGQAARAVETAVFGRPLHQYKFADPRDPEGAFRDPANVVSAAAQFVPGGTLAVGARLAAAAGRVNTAGKLARALQAYRGASTAAKAARFGAQAATDAALSYGSSRLSEFTPNYTAGEALAGGLLGSAMTRAGGNLVDATQAGMNKAAAAASKATGNAGDVGLQELPLVWRAPQKTLRPKGKADETVRYLTQDLGLGADALPASVLSAKDVIHPTASAERVLGSSPIGGKYVNRWTNLNRILQKRTADLIGDADAYVTIENLRRRWPNIADKVYGEHFNLGRSFEHRPDIAEGLRAAEANQLQALERMFGAPELRDQASEILSRVSAAPNTSAFLASRIKELEKSLGRGSLGSLDSPDMAELNELKKIRARVQERDISPLQRLEDLEDIRRKIDVNVFKNPNKKVTPDQAKTFKQVKHFLLDDMGQLLGNKEWFGDIAEIAADAWNANRTKMRTFGKGARELEQYIAPDRIDAKGLRSRLVNDQYFNDAIRTTLEMGGDEGRELLGEMESLALDAALGEDKKMGIPWTSAANKYNADATRHALETLMGADSKRLAEMRTILDAGSRMGAPVDAGSAASRNFGELSRKQLKKLKDVERQYLAGRADLLADQGLGNRGLFDMADLLEKEGGMPRGEMVEPVAPKVDVVPSVTAPQIPKAVRTGASVVGATVGGNAGRKVNDARRGLGRLAGVDDEPPEDLTELEKRLWRETGWRPRPDVGGFAVD